MGSGSRPAHEGWAHNHLKIQFLFWLLWARTHVVNVNLHRHTHMHKKFFKKKKERRTLKASDMAQWVKSLLWQTWRPVFGHQHP